MRWMRATIWQQIKADMLEMQAAQLARALRNLHPDITQYKTVSAFKEQALAYLDKVAAKALVAA